MAIDLSNDQAKTLKELGAMFFTFKECAIILEIETSIFINEMKSPGSVAYKTYYAGYYSSMLQIRKSIMELAIRGSGPAQQQMIKIIDNAMSGKG